MNAHVRATLGDKILRLVSGLPSGKRERRRFVVLKPQAYIDDSGDDPTKRYFVLAGFVARAASWNCLPSSYPHAGHDQRSKRSEFE